jgi:protein TonB
MRSRGQLAVAVIGSFVLHALLLFGLPGMSVSMKSANRASAPIQVTLIGIARKQAVVPPAPIVPSVPPRPEADPQSTEARPQAPAPSTQSAARQAPVSAQPAVKPAPAVAAASTQPTPSFRSGAELDPPPRPLGDIEPEYPPAAGLQQGTVVLRLMIDTSGDVEDVVVVSATPEGLFEASAIAAFGKAKFSPGRYLGIPVRSQVTIAVDYTPTDRGSAVSGQAAAIGPKR